MRNSPHLIYSFQGNPCRDVVLKHIKDCHGPGVQPVDDRLKFGVQIKEMIRRCYPAYFVDAPVPTAADLEKLLAFKISVFFPFLRLF